MKEHLCFPGHIRYMDDVILWDDDDTTRLKDALAHGIACLATLGLKPKPTPSINPTPHGLEALGCRGFLTHVILSRRTRIRFRRKVAALETTDMPEAEPSVQVETRTHGRGRPLSLRPR